MIKLPYETPEFRIAITEADIRATEPVSSGENVEFPEVTEPDD